MHEIFSSLLVLVPIVCILNLKNCKQSRYTTSSHQNGHRKSNQSNQTQSAEIAFVEHTFVPPISHRTANVAHAHSAHHSDRCGPRPYRYYFDAYS